MMPGAENVRQVLGKDSYETKILVGPVKRGTRTLITISTANYGNLERDQGTSRKKFCGPGCSGNNGGGRN